MNRKISTLFTAGLLVAGSLCGSAFAQNSIQRLLGLGSAVTELKSGAYVMTDANGLAYGFTSVSEMVYYKKVFLIIKLLLLRMTRKMM